MNYLKKAEKGTIIKNPENKLKIVLVYPNTYRVGMSNLGFQTVYSIINRFEHITCERIFLDTPYSIESKKKLASFDIIAFSVSFETDYLNIYRIIAESGIPPEAEMRNNNSPLIIAGGVACFLNPEPIAPFIDSFLIGEAEELLPSFFGQIESGRQAKADLADLAGKIKGLYIPKFYKTIYDSDGFIRKREIIADVPEKVKRTFVKNLSDIKPAETKILTHNTIFDNTFLIEAGRGCPHRCRFCGIGYIYGPPRYRSYDSLKESIQRGSLISDKIGLVSANVSDLPHINKLCEYAALSDNIRLSFSSLRADALSGDLANALFKSGVKTATIAPDAGSEKMRKIIAKGITEKDILGAAAFLVEKGIPNLRLYFMIGLPFETDQDIEEIIVLTKKIKKVFLEASRKQKRIGRIIVSLNAFAPKPFTPFQWAKMESLRKLNKKVRHITNGLKGIGNIEIRADKPKKAYIQTLFARGDRQVADIIKSAHQNNLNSTGILKKAKNMVQFYTERKRSFDEIFPWDFIDHGIKKEFLAKEYKNSRKQSSIDNRL